MIGLLLSNIKRVAPQSFAATSKAPQLWTALRLWSSFSSRLTLGGWDSTRTVVEGKELAAVAWRGQQKEGVAWVDAGLQPSTSGGDWQLSLLAPSLLGSS